MTLDKDLLEILRCPKCKGELEIVGEDTAAFDCIHCKLRFPVLNGIPNFIVDEAEPLERHE